MIVWTRWRWKNQEVDFIPWDRSQYVMEWRERWHWTGFCAYCHRTITKRTSVSIQLRGCASQRVCKKGFGCRKERNAPN